MICNQCNHGHMVPQYYMEDNVVYVCGLICTYCLREEITSIMTTSEYNKIAAGEVL